MSDENKHWPTGKEVMQSGRCEHPKAQSSFAAPAGSASAWTSQIAGLEEKTDKLRDAAYRAKRYDLSAALQDVKRALYKIRVNESQTPNDRTERTGGAMKPMTDEQKQDANSFFASQFDKSEPPVRSSELVVLSRKGVMPVNHATNCQCETCRMTFKGQRRGASHPPKDSNA